MQLKLGDLMTYITQELSVYSIYTLVPIYSLLLVNLIYVLFLKKHKTEYKYKGFALLSCIISMIAVGSQIFYQGVLRDNLIDVKNLSLQTDIVFLIHLILLVIVLTSIIKKK